MFFFVVFLFLFLFCFFRSRQLHTDILIACSLAAKFYVITISSLQLLVWYKNQTGAAANSGIMSWVSKVFLKLQHTNVVVHACIIISQ